MMSQSGDIELDERSPAQNPDGTSSKNTGKGDGPENVISAENEQLCTIRCLKWECSPSKECKCEDRTEFDLLKFCVVLIQICLITAQAYLFAHERSKFSDIVNRGHITLRHLLLKGWESGMETDPYPPARGEFAVYEIEELIGSINYAVERYFNAEYDAIGFYKRLPHKGRNDSIIIRMTYFDFPGFHSSMRGLHIKDYNQFVGMGLNLRTDPATNKTRYTYNIEELFELLNITEPVRRLLTVHLDFTIHSVRVNEELTGFVCLFIDGTVSFLDAEYNGQMIVDLNTKTNKLSCPDIGYNMTNSPDDNTSMKGLSCAVFLTCILFAVVAFIYFGIGIKSICKKTTCGMIKKTLRKLCKIPNEGDNPTDPECHEYCKLWKSLMWDVLILVSDVLIIVGVSKMDSLTTYTLSDFDNWAILLGIGGLLSYLNLFQFFNVCSSFSILLDILSGAFMVMLGYLISTVVLFFGFVLCGYVILGPYHVKFQTVSTTIETLFSICNGDELYATLANVESSKSGNISAVLVFSHFYICTYVAVFTIVVLNILIAIFVDAYDRIKKKQEKEKE